MLLKEPKKLKTCSRRLAETCTYTTLFGKYDFVGIVEVPKDEDIAKILLCIGSMGNIRTKTMKAWTETEFEKLITGAHEYQDKSPL